MSKARSFQEVTLGLRQLERFLRLGAGCLLLCSLACSAPRPLVLATFEGGAITPRDLEDVPTGTTTTELVGWVEAQAVRAADRRIVLSVAEQQGITTEPALRLRAKTGVAVDLAMRRIQRSCTSTGGMSSAAPLSRAWIEVHRLVRELTPTTSAEERESARSDLAIAAEAWRRGAEVSELARQYSTQGERLLSRIQPDSVLDPTLMSTARSLADGEVSEVIRTRSGFEVVRRVRSGEDPRPNFRRTSDSLTDALREIRAAACPELLARAGRKPAEPVVDREPEGPMLRIAGETYDRSVLAALGVDDDSLESVLEEVDLAFQLADGQVSAATRARLDEEELQRLATLETLLRARRELLEEWGEEEVAAYLAREADPSSLDPQPSRTALVEGPAASALDRPVLERLRAKSRFALDRQAILVYAQSLRR